MQQTHTDYKPNTTLAKIILFCDGVHSPANQGALFRLADAFGVAHILFANATVITTSGRLRRTARKTEKTIPFELVSDPIHDLQQLREKGYSLIALELTNASKDISQIVIDKNPIVLMIGSENKGLSETILALSNHQVHIPMYGVNSSMNVAQATAIALYELTKRVVSK